jgi:hypothetical protein
MSPVTLLFGPVFTYNLLSVLAPALSAYTAFILSRQLTKHWLASIFAGYIFGFSSYNFGHLLAGHFNLDITCLIPVAILLCVRYMQVRIGRGWFIASLAVTLALELGVSTEISATLCFFGATAWLIFWLYSPADGKIRLQRMAIDLAGAGAAAALLSSPELFYLLEGFAHLAPILNSTAVYSTDPLNYVIPTSVTRFGGVPLFPISQMFTGNCAEQGAYFGAPLLIIALFYFRDNIGRRTTQAFLTLTGMLAIATLGPWLHLGPTQTEIPLPWTLIEKMPVIRYALPCRFTMYISLCIAVATAFHLSLATTGWQRITRYGFVSLSCLLLIPSVAPPKPWPMQPLFTAGNITRELGKNRNVLILPIGPYGNGMAWQVDAGMSFTQSSGYVGSQPASEQALPAIAEINQASAGMTPIPADFAANLAAYCASHRIDDILLATDAPPSLYRAVESLGWPQREVDGVHVIRIP